MTEATATFGATPESVRDARRFVRDAVAPIDDDLADDAALLTSELATNAVIHARTGFVVTIRHAPDGVRVEVRDGSTAPARRSRYSATSGTGRGLGMVDDLAETWGVEESGDGKAIWFTLTTRQRATSDDDGAAAGDGDLDDADLDALLAGLGGDDDGLRSDAALRRAA